MIFETSRLIARRIESGDVPALVALRGDPEVARFQSWESFDDAAARALVDEQSCKEPGQAGWFQFALERKSDDALIGDCGLKVEESEPRLAQIGYTIGRPFWRQGYATEAVTALIGYGFQNFPFHRISASVDPRNQASLGVLANARLCREALFRQSVWFKGAWADDAIYAILRTDWQP